MGKFTTFSRRTPPKKRPWEVHPIWRGIGCLLFLMGPFISFAAAHYIVELDLAQGWLAVPREMSAAFTLPVVDYTINHALADVLVAILLLLLGFAAVMIIYSVMYSIMGPSRLGPMDAPPIRGGRRRR